MCWVALDRGVRLARLHDSHAIADKWQAIADEIHADILAQRCRRARGVLVQRYGSDALDASLLLAPLVRFLPPDDPRIRATVLAIADELTHEGLVLRYRVEETDDGLAGEEGTFTICSFWLVSALVEIGEDERAHALCERLLSHASTLGLYAEELDPITGRHLGNFPQAFTHLALINAVTHVIRAEESLPGARFRPGQPAGLTRQRSASGCSAEFTAWVWSVDRVGRGPMARTRLGSERSGWHPLLSWARPAALTGAIAVMLRVMLLPGAAAAAEPPFRVPTQITDRAGALSGSDQADVQAALDKLSSEDNINLFVVYVENFDNPTGGQAWGEQTYLASDLGRQRHAAVDRDRSAATTACGSPPNFKLSTSQLDQVAEQRHPPTAGGRATGPARPSPPPTGTGRRSAARPRSGGGSPAASSWSVAAATCVYRRSRRKTAADGTGPRSARTGSRRNRWSRSTSCPRAACRPSSTPTTPYGPANSSSAPPNPSSATTPSRSSARPSTRPANR